VILIAIAIIVVPIVLVILPFGNFSSPITQDDIENEKEKITKLNCEDLKWYIGTHVNSPYGKIANDEFKSRCE